MHACHIDTIVHGQYMIENQIIVVHPLGTLGQNNGQCLICTSQVHPTKPSSLLGNTAKALLGSVEIVTRCWIGMWVFEPHW